MRIRTSRRGFAKVVAQYSVVDPYQPAVDDLPPARFAHESGLHAKVLSAALAANDAQGALTRGRKRGDVAM